MKRLLIAALALSCLSVPCDFVIDPKGATFSTEALSPSALFQHHPLMTLLLKRIRGLHFYYQRQIRKVHRSHWGIPTEFAAQIHVIQAQALQHGIELSALDLYGVGLPFNPDGPSVQIGVNPHTLTPQANRAGMSESRIDYYRSQERDTTITVDRDGVLQQGHHRLAAAILEGRVVDVMVQRHATLHASRMAA